MNNMGVITIISERASEDERQANACLIAASPRMYDYIAKQAKDGNDEAKSILEGINAGSE